LSDPFRAFEECTLIILRRFPSLYFVLKSLKVVYVNRSKTLDIHGIRGKVTAETDGRRITLYRDWLYLDDRERVVTLIHEILHAILLHPIRKREMVMKKIEEGFGPKAYLDLLANAAVDAKVYEFMDMMNIKTGGQRYRGLSAEEIFEKLVEEAPKVGRVITDVYVKTIPDIAESYEEGLVLNRGRDELERASDYELEELIKRIALESVLIAKTAGMSLTAFDEWILDHMSPTLNWKVLLRRIISLRIARNFVRTWTRVNRKSGDFPGYREIAKPVIWCFVDVSGSISYDEFRQFVGEVLRASKEAAKTVLVLWDTDVRGEIEIRRIEDTAGVRFKRGGGTTFRPVIEAYRKKIKPGDVVACLTDGLWKDKEEAYGILRDVRAMKILVYTVKPVPGFDVKIRLLPPH